MEKNVRGIKLFQKEVELLNLYVNEFSSDEHGNHMTSSALATYLLLRDECDAFGEIIVQDLNLAQLARKANMKYSTVYSAFLLLNKLKLVKSYFRENGMEIYQLTNIKDWNFPENGETLNYYYLPRKIFTCDILPNLVKAKDMHGILALLDLSNSLYRQASQHKSDMPIKRKESSLITKFKKNRRNKKSFIARLQSFFKMEQIQRVDDDLWEVKFTEDCFETENNSISKKLTAAIRKEVSFSFQHFKKQYRKNDLNDVNRVISHVAIQHFLPLLESYGVQKAKHWLKDIHIASFEALLEKTSRTDIGSIGSYYRTVFQDYINYQFNRLDPGMQLELQTYWANHFDGRPGFIKPISN